MNSGLTQASDLSQPERMLLIKSKTFLGKFTVGTCKRLLDATEPGFWFLVVQGTSLHFSGKW